MEIINTSVGEICVKRIGKGYPVIVIPGGPGLSYKYMEKPLIDAFKQLNLNIELIFFEHLGVSFSKTNYKINIKNSVIAFNESLKKLNLQEIDIISHSWGAYYIYSSLENQLFNNLVKNIILLNPIPFDKKNYDLVGKNLVSRISEEDSSFINDLFNEGTLKAGRKLMSIALPYYSGRKTNLSEIAFDYNIQVYKENVSSMEAFDFFKLVKANINKIIFIFGKDDYIKEDNFLILNENVFYLKGGHFSFIDDQSTFKNIIKRIYF